MNTKIAIVVLIIAVIFAGGVFYLVGGLRDGKKILPTEAGNGQEAKLQSDKDLENETGQVEPNVKQFSVVAANYSFDPTEIRVNKGDKVRISLQSAEGSHDWTLDDFKVHTPIVSPGEEVTVQFVADAVGTFEYYCSQSNHRQMGMVGKLIVE